MRNVNFVNASVLASHNNGMMQGTSPWNVISLSEGYSGILLLFSELDRLYPNERWDEASHEYVVRIKEIIEFKGINDLSLFSGLTGVCLSLQEASRQGSRYSKLLKTLNAHLIAKVEEFCLERTRSLIHAFEPCPAHLYDIISGICGIGVYALKNIDSCQFYELAKEIVRLLVLLVRPIKMEGKTVPGWYLPNKYLMTSDEKSHFPKGMFNLGMAHGVPGVLAFLSIAHMYGITVEGHFEAIKQISSWLQEKRRGSQVYFWPSRISYEEEIGEEKSNTYFRDAWCYGTPGVARSLFLAGLAIKDEVLKKLAIESFQSIFLRDTKAEDLLSPTFCHGIAGLLTITHHMVRDTQNVYLEEKLHVIKNLLIGTYNASFPFGFQNVMPLSRGSFKHDEIGILIGASGVLLSLLSFHISYPTWDFPFLISTNLPLAKQNQFRQLSEFACRV